MWRCHIKDIRSGGVNMKKKYIFIIIIVVIVFLVGLIFLMFRDTTKIVLKNNEFIFELGEDISGDVLYYLENTNHTKNIQDYKLSSDDLKIRDKKLVMEDTEFVGVGEYSIDIKYKKLSKKIVIKVIDTIAPEFKDFKEEIELEQTTEDIDLVSFFEATDLAQVNIRIEGEYNLNTEGDYKINVIANDPSGNESMKETVIKVKKKEIVIETPPITQEKPPKIENQNPSNTPGSSNNQESGQPNNSSTPRYRTDIAESYINQVNSYRKSKGLPELPVTTEAQAEADRRAKEISIYYSHDGAGYGFGEIIGDGSIGSDFITAWKNSPPHNAAMLREQNVAMAASVYEYNNYWYAVISFRMNY